MAVALMTMNYETNIASFSFDDWAIDGDKLPRIGIAGKDALSTVGSCAQGSFAIGTDGSIKVLKGDSNEWIDY